MPRPLPSWERRDEHKKKETQTCQPKHHWATSWAAIVSLSQGQCRVLFRRQRQKKKKNSFVSAVLSASPDSAMNSSRTKPGTAVTHHRSCCAALTEANHGQCSFPRSRPPGFFPLTQQIHGISRPPKLNIHQDQREGWTRNSFVIDNRLAAGTMGSEIGALRHDKRLDDDYLALEASAKRKKKKKKGGGGLESARKGGETKR
ncbi:hypothetical protein LX36DRAFT_197651 [Colletotrichum falcatum]|nr:hypothetical protein LX36DRAFT_197651 [Colletotrichum falcatum]